MQVHFFNWWLDFIRNYEILLTSTHFIHYLDPPSHHLLYGYVMLWWYVMSRWHCGAVVITTTQLHSTKPELRFCTSSNPARGVSEIRDGEDLWKWSPLEIRLNVFRRSAIPPNNSLSSSSSPWENTIHTIGKLSKSAGRFP